jgi:hypothetical protein
MYAVCELTGRNLTFPLSEDFPSRPFGQGHGVRIQRHQRHLWYSLEKSVCLRGLLHGVLSHKDSAIGELAVSSLENCKDEPPSGIHVSQCTPCRAHSGPNGPNHHPMEGHLRCRAPYF